MTNEDDIKIVERFFGVIERLIEDGAIKGVQTFTRRYGINRWNFITLKKEPHRQFFQVAWLFYLVRDYGISADYLLTGEGEVYAPVPDEATTRQLTNAEIEQLLALLPAKTCKNCATEK